MYNAFILYYYFLSIKKESTSETIKLNTDTSQKERLIITMILDKLPEGDLPLSFSVSQVKELWISRFKWFKDWKRVIYTPVPITSLKVEKL